jgi:signal transduction histidine kinase
LRNERAEESAEREFITNAAHELQSPLAAIVSAIEVLQAGAKDTPDRDIFLGHIEDASDRLAKLTRALLVLARAQTGSEEPKTELVPLRLLLDDVAAKLRPAPGVGVEISCPRDAAVVTNRELLQQSVDNLAENAVKYTMRGRIEIGARTSDVHAEVWVRDTGPGIPEHDHERVFERFYRGPSDGSGSGLGLAIARAAAEAIGGEIELETSMDEGTVVRISLPRAAHLIDQ